MGYKWRTVSLVSCMFFAVFMAVTGQNWEPFMAVALGITALSDISS